MSWLPAVAVNAMLEGFAALGLDRAKLIDALGPDASLSQEPGAMVDREAFGHLWAVAQQQWPDSALPTALGLAIPYGAFAFTDYLAGSSDTVGGGFESLALHLKLVARSVTLQIERVEDLHWVKLLTPDEEEPPYCITEMTLAIFVARFRRGTDGAFQPAFVCLRCEASRGESEQARLLGVPVRHASPVAAVAISDAMWNLRLRRADPYLRATLARTVEQLGLAHTGSDALEIAIRARLRDALADESAEPGRIARLLGMSERTMQRRLADCGRTFSAVLDTFRKEEAARLLGDRTLTLADIAARLGYREQTSFTRAFRRWTGKTPVNWRREHAAR